MREVGMHVSASSLPRACAHQRRGSTPISGAAVSPHQRRGSPPSRATRGRAGPEPRLPAMQATASGARRPGPLHSGLAPGPPGKLSQRARSMGWSSCALTWWYATARRTSSACTRDGPYRPGAAIEEAAGPLVRGVVFPQAEGVAVSTICEVKNGRIRVVQGTIFQIRLHG